MNGAARLRLELLGNPRILLDGLSADGLGSKAVALLAFLARQIPTRVPRATLAQLLWSDRPADQARQSLRQLLSRMRRLLDKEGELLDIDGEFVGLDSAAITSDVFEFETLAKSADVEDQQRALDLWRGGFLEGVRAVSPAFDEWALQERARLNRARVDALYRRAKLALESADPTEAESACRTLLGVAPDFEPALRLLMLALCRSDRPAAALSSYADLIAELDRANRRPENETEQLAEEIRQAVLADESDVRASVEQDSPDLGSWRLLAPIAVAAIIAAMLAVVFFSRIRSDIDNAPQPTLVVENLQSLAVLPFNDYSKEGEARGYFADGLTEELTARLAQISELRVAGRTSAFIFKDQPVDLREAGQRMGVTQVLEGSVRWSGPRLRVTAQLVSTEDGYHLWSKTYDRQDEEILNLHEEIAREVAEALKVTLNGVSIAGTPGGTSELAAYDVYLRARSVLQRGNKADDDRAQSLFEEATRIDPTFALAWAGLAESLIAGRFGTPMPKSSYVRARTAAMRALELEPSLHRPHWVLGWASIAEGNYNLATDHFRRSSELEGPSPRCIESDFVQVVFSADIQSSVDCLRQAVSLDPLAKDVSSRYHMMLYLAGRYDEMEAEYERSKDFVIHPHRASLENFTLQRLWQQGDRRKIAEQIALLREHYVRPGSPADRLYDVWDDSDAALALLREELARRKASNAPFDSYLFLMRWLGAYGDADASVEAFRQHVIGGVQGGFHVTMTPLMMLQPEYALARAHPGSKEVYKQLGWAAYWRNTGHWPQFCSPVPSGADFVCE